MVKTDNLNIRGETPLSSPQQIRRELPLDDGIAEAVLEARTQIENILLRRDQRHLMVVGPCSIHNVDGAVEYAERLRSLSDRVRDRIVLAMRVYFEKPRTILGWKGLIYDPDLDGSCDIEKGLRLARKTLLQVGKLALPAATEILEPVVPQYITDLVAWGAIGARTAESQTHRQMASGLSMPTGFKNATDGSLKVAVEAIRTAASPHTFIGITGDGRVGVFRTKGNPFGHLVLRGGKDGPNYGSEHVAFASELMKKAGLRSNIVIDCSHANSGKVPECQAEALRDVLAQLESGSPSIAGTMLESNLQGGRQSAPDTASQAERGQSVTDACLGWDETEALILEAHGRLRQQD